MHNEFLEYKSTIRLTTTQPGFEPTTSLRLSFENVSIIYTKDISLYSFARLSLQMDKLSQTFFLIWPGQHIENIFPSYLHHISIARVTAFPVPSDNRFYEEKILFSQTKASTWLRRKTGCLNAFRGFRYHICYYKKPPWLCSR